MTTYRVTVQTVETGLAQANEPAAERFTELLIARVEANGPPDLPAIIAAIQRTKRLRKSRAKQAEAA